MNTKGDIEILRRYLFANHKPYCAYERKWWERRHFTPGTSCICDEPRQALERIERQLSNITSNLTVTFEGTEDLPAALRLINEQAVKGRVRAK